MKALIGTTTVPNEIAPFTQEFDLGFAVDAVIVIVSTRTSAGGAMGGSSLSYGLATSSAERVISGASADNAVTQQTKAQNDLTVLLTNASGSTLCSANVTIGATGFDLDWTALDGNEYEVGYVVFSEADNAVINDIGNTGDYSETGLGFDPEAIFVVMTTFTGYPGSVSGRVVTGMGVAEGVVAAGGTAYVEWSNSDHSSGDLQRQNSSDSTFLIEYGATNRDSFRLALATGGFDYTKVLGTTAFLHPGLALAGSLSVTTGTFTEPTAPDTDQAPTGFGFQPGLIFFGVAKPTVGSNTGSASWGFAGYDGEGNWTHFSFARFGTRSSNRDGEGFSSNSFAFRRSSDAVLLSEFTSSPDADGFTATWTTNNESSMTFHYAAFNVNEAEIASAEAPDMPYIETNQPYFPETRMVAY